MTKKNFKKSNFHVGKKNERIVIVAISFLLIFIVCEKGY